MDTQGIGLNDFANGVLITAPLHISLHSYPLLGYWYEATVAVWISPLVGQGRSSTATAGLLAGLGAEGALLDAIGHCP